MALVDYFTPDPPVLFSACAEIHPIDPEFGERRELWRMFAYLGILTVDSGSAWSRPLVGRLADAVRRYAGRSWTAWLSVDQLRVRGGR